jgi:hypothetical protein
MQHRRLRAALRVRELADSACHRFIGILFILHGTTANYVQYVV